MSEERYRSEATTWRTQSAQLAIQNLSKLAMQFRLVSTTQEMFNWHISEGAPPESMQYQAHWLSHLRPHKAAEQKIRELTTRTLEYLPTSLLCKAHTKDTCESYHKMSQRNWQRFVSDQLFPYSAPSEPLLVQLGPDELPWSILGQPRWRGPDFVYCLTDAIFGQRGSKIQNVLQGQHYTAPYLTVYFESNGENEVTEKRAKSYGTNMVYARLMEWCRAAKLNSHLSMPRPSTSAASLTSGTSNREGKDGWTKLKSAISSTLKSANAEGKSSRSISRPPPPSSSRLAGQPLTTPGATTDEGLSHYCIMINPKSFTVWKLVPDLVLRSGGVEWKGITCIEYKRRYELTNDDGWRQLTNSILEIHLVSAAYGGKLVEKCEGSKASIHLTAVSQEDNAAAPDDSALNSSSQWKAERLDDEWLSIVDEMTLS